MQPRITSANVERLRAAVDAATRLHRLGLLLFFAACVLVTWPAAQLPTWLPQTGLAATLLAFACKALATRREIRLLRRLGRIMALPYRRAVAGNDHGAWSAIRSYVAASIVLTVAAALAPSMLAALGETLLSNLVAMLCVAALVLQSFDNPQRMHNRVLQICRSRLDPHADADDVLAA